MLGNFFRCDRSQDEAAPRVSKAARRHEQEVGELRFEVTISRVEQQVAQGSVAKGESVA
jgi:hypothetical protein